MKRNNEIQVNELSKETKVSLKVRIISSIICVAIALPCLIVGDFFWAVLLGFLLTVSVFEIIRCAKTKYSIILYICAYLAAFVLTYFPIIISNIGGDSWRIFQGFSQIKVSFTVIAVSVILLFGTVVFDKNFTVKDACFIFTMILVTSLAFQCNLFLRYFPSYYHYNLEVGNELGSYFNKFDNLESGMLVLYVILGALFTDIGAYFFGIFFGHKKINERISEKKTWAGFMGGIGTSFVITSAFAMIFAIVGHPLGGFLTLDRWYHILILSLILPFISTLGDFVYSSVKRFYGIKDFGKIIPGHGGVLDRIDSVIFASIAAAIYISIFFGNPGGLMLP